MRAVLIRPLNSSPSKTVISIYLKQQKTMMKGAVSDGYITKILRRLRGYISKNFTPHSWKRKAQIRKIRMKQYLYMGDLKALQ